jgi:hypothetical protein
MIIIKNENLTARIESISKVGKAVLIFSQDIVNMNRRLLASKNYTALMDV